MDVATAKQYYGELPIGIAVFNKGTLVYSNAWFENLAGSALLEFPNAESSRKSLIDGIQARLARKMWVIRRLRKDGKADVFRLEVTSLASWPGFRLVSIISLHSLDDAPIVTVSGNNTYIFSQLRLDSQDRVARYKKQILNLSKTEFGLLEFFCQNEGSLLSKSTLLKRVWGSTATETRSLDMAVSRLRKKLFASGCTKPTIVNLRGQGYLLTNT